MYLLMTLFVLAAPQAGAEATIQGLILDPTEQMRRELDDLNEQVYRISIIVCYAARPRDECDELREPNEFKAEQDRRLGRDPNL